MRGGEGEGEGEGEGLGCWIGYGRLEWDGNGKIMEEEEGVSRVLWWEEGGLLSMSILVFICV